MDSSNLEDMVTELEADAKAVETLTLDVICDPSEENGNKMHAILKLAEDQKRITEKMSAILAEMG